jgi:hypothetical protein
LHNFIQKDREIALLNKRHEICHEDDTMWCEFVCSSACKTVFYFDTISNTCLRKRGLNARGEMPDDAEMVMVSNAIDQRQGERSDLSSARRKHITMEMKIHKCKRPKGSKEAQEIRLNRAIANLTCA